jgi:hypothetical protein
MKPSCINTHLQINEGQEGKIGLFQWKVGGYKERGKRV